MTRQGGAQRLQYHRRSSGHPDAPAVLQVLLHPRQHNLDLQIMRIRSLQQLPLMRLHLRHHLRLSILRSTLLQRTRPTREWPTKKQTLSACNARQLWVQLLIPQLQCRRARKTKFKQACNPGKRHTALPLVFSTRRP